MPLLRDGWKSLITISGISALFEEIELTPPGLDSTGTIDQTTMRNNAWRTAIGKGLRTLTSFSVKVAYDPAVYPQIRDILGRNRHIVITFPDGSTLTFYAIVDKFTPDALKEGERPEATIEFMPSNLTTSSPPAEFSPIFATGTTTTTAP